MYDQSKLSELIRFARIKAGSTVIDVYPGDRPAAGKPASETASGGAGEGAPVARTLRANGREVRRHRDHASA